MSKPILDHETYVRNFLTAAIDTGVLRPVKKELFDRFGSESFNTTEIENLIEMQRRHCRSCNVATAPRVEEPMRLTVTMEGGLDKIRHLFTNILNWEAPDVSEPPSAADVVETFRRESKGPTKKSQVNEVADEVASKLKAMARRKKDK